ncbi:MAG: hypothetical protein M3Y41_22235, partial [Pseudomonadota bacterium]|nr:hypothetical protein [Pseudomonadota bacterium]
LAGRLSLPEAAACIERAVLYVGNDSGLMHLAAATGTPTLGLFGPTPAAEYAPAGLHAAAVIAARGSMDGLTVEDALSAATSLLAYVSPRRLRRDPPPTSSPVRTSPAPPA